MALGPSGLTPEFVAALAQLQQQVHPPDVMAAYPGGQPDIGAQLQQLQRFGGDITGNVRPPVHIDPAVLAHPLVNQMVAANPRIAAFAQALRTQHPEMQKARQQVVQDLLARGMSPAAMQSKMPGLAGGSGTPQVMPQRPLGA